MTNISQVYNPASAVDVIAETQTVVQIKAAWADTWQSVAFLRPLELQNAASPTQSSASFEWLYGQIDRPQHNGVFYTYTPVTLDGYFIRVLWISYGGSQVLWVGEIIMDSFEMYHAACGIAGNQVIHAVGLERRLDRVSIIGAYVWGSFIGLEAPQVSVIEHCPTFNKPNRRGLTQIGNRSATREPITNMWHFVGGSGAALWTNLDILEYLLYYYQPGGPVYVLGGALEALNCIVQVHRLEGQTLYQALDHLVDRRRGLGWAIRTTGEGTVYVYIYSLMDAPVTVDGATLPANPEQITLTIDGRTDISQTMIAKKASEQYDQILVLGSRIKVCCGLSVANIYNSVTQGVASGVTISVDGLTVTWTGGTITDTNGESVLIVEGSAALTDNVTNYLRWISGNSLDIGTTPPSSPQILISTITCSGESASHEQPMGINAVLLSPSLSASWTSGEETLYKTNPVGDTPATDDSTMCDLARASDYFKRIYQAYILKAAWDGLHGDAVNGWRQVAFQMNLDGTLSETAAPIWFNGGQRFLKYLPILQQGSDTEYLHPMVFALHPEKGWVQLDSCTESETPGAHISLCEGEPTLFIIPKINHILGLNHFEGEGTQASTTDPVYDWDTLVATVFIETDARLKVLCNCAPTLVANPRTLTIEIDNAEFWYQTPYTPVGAIGGALVWNDAGGIVRDDSSKLRFIAAMAAQWYSRKRAMVQLHLEGIQPVGLVGQYIRTVSSGWHSEQVNTVITSQHWTFRGDKPSSTVETGFLDISSEAFVEFPGFSKPRAFAREVARMRRETGDALMDVGNPPVRITRPGASGGTGSGSGDIDPHSHTTPADGQIGDMTGIG
jgi:hypothetical protein